MSNYNSQLQSNNTDLQTVLQTLQTKAAGCEQATPEISVSSNGLITATAGTKTSTHQLAFQPAKTITPSTASQIAVSSGYYTGGVVTVKGDSNLIAGNIKSGVSIFGVSGTYAGSGGDTSVEDSLIARTISNYTNSRVSAIGSYAFYSCTTLITVSCQTAREIGQMAFFSCKNLTTAIFPAVSSLSTRTFEGCNKLTTISFPELRYINNSMFNQCFSLTTASFPRATNIGFSAFCYCRNLKSLYLTSSSICKLDGSTAFYSTPIGGYSASAGTYGSIYVPASLLTSYKNSTNWVFFSSRFVGI